MSSQNGQSGYTPKERKIFKFQDGSRWRVVDPMAVERAMSRQLGPDWEQLHRPMQKLSEFWIYRTAGQAIKAAEEAGESVSPGLLPILLKHAESIGKKFMPTVTLEDLARLDPGDKVWADLTDKCGDANEKLSTAAAVAFKVQPLAIDEETGEATGWLESEIQNLLTRWIVFMRGLADAARPLPLSPPNMASGASDQVTASSAASGVVAASA